MRRRISSSTVWQYRYSTVLSSVFVFGLPSALLVVVGFFALSGGRPAAAIGSLILALGVACLGVLLSIAWIRLPHVEIDESRIYAWGWGKKVAIPFSGIASVTQQGGLVVVRLRERSAMGRVIRFMPQWNDPWWWGPNLVWSPVTHSIVDELQVLVREAGKSP